MKVKFDGPFPIQGDIVEWICILGDLPGMVTVGKSKAEAWKQMMISLKIKIAFDSGITLPELNELDAAPASQTPEKADIINLITALRDIDLEGDFVDPPSTVKKCAGIAGKAIEQFYQKFPNYTL